MKPHGSPLEGTSRPEGVPSHSESMSFHRGTGINMDDATRNHLRLLSIFHYVLAGLAGLFSLFPIVHIAMGVAMISGALDRGSASPPPPAFGWLFVAMGVAFMLVGFGYVALVAVAGRFLARKRHWTFCVVVAALSCAFFPFGTVLGVFTIIVLAKPEVKAAFEAGDAILPTTVAPRA